MMGSANSMIEVEWRVDMGGCHGKLHSGMPVAIWAGDGIGKITPNNMILLTISRIWLDKLNEDCCGRVGGL